MMLVDHINAVVDGKVFCYKEQDVIELNPKKCYGCPYLNGTGGGHGMECLWEDKDEGLVQGDEMMWYADNPEVEKVRVTYGSPAYNAKWAEEAFKNPEAYLNSVEKPNTKTELEKAMELDSHMVIHTRLFK